MRHCSRRVMGRNQGNLVAFICDLRDNLLHGYYKMEVDSGANAGISSDQRNCAVRRPHD